MFTGTPVPGTTYSGITLNSGTTNFPSGVYVISGGSFTVTGSATITGTGVTFYFTNNATISVSGGGSLQLTAPTTGPYAGILFFQDPNDTNPPLLGGAGNSPQRSSVFPEGASNAFREQLHRGYRRAITHPEWQPDN